MRDEWAAPRKRDAPTRYTRPFVSRAKPTAPSRRLGLPLQSNHDLPEDMASLSVLHPAPVVVITIWGGEKDVIDSSDAHVNAEAINPGVVDDIVKIVQSIDELRLPNVRLQNNDRENSRKDERADRGTERSVSRGHASGIDANHSIMTVCILFSPPATGNANGPRHTDLHERTVEGVPKPVAEQMLQDFASYQERASQSNQYQLYRYASSRASNDENERMIALDFGEVCALGALPDDGLRT